MCNKEEFQVELSRKIVLSAYAMANFYRSCVYALFKLISIARYAFKSPRICFRGTKHDINRDKVAYVRSILFAGPGFDYNCLQVQ